MGKYDMGIVADNIGVVEQELGDVANLHLDDSPGVIRKFTPAGIAQQGMSVPGAKGLVTELRENLKEAERKYLDLAKKEREAKDSKKEAIKASTRQEDAENIRDSMVEAVDAMRRNLLDGRVNRGVLKKEHTHLLELSEMMRGRDFATRAAWDAAVHPAPSVGLALTPGAVAIDTNDLSRGFIPGPPELGGSASLHAAVRVQLRGGGQPISIGQSLEMLSSQAANFQALADKMPGIQKQLETMLNDPAASNHHELEQVKAKLEALAKRIEGMSVADHAEKLKKLHSFSRVDELASDELKALSEGVEGGLLQQLSGYLDLRKKFGTGTLEEFNQKLSDGKLAGEINDLMQALRASGLQPSDPSGATPQQKTLKGLLDQVTDLETKRKEFLEVTTAFRGTKVSVAATKASTEARRAFESAAQLNGTADFTTLLKKVSSQLQTAIEKALATTEAMQLIITAQKIEAVTQALADAKSEKETAQSAADQQAEMLRKHPEIDSARRGLDQAARKATEQLKQAEEKLQSAQQQHDSTMGPLTAAQNSKKALAYAKAIAEEAAQKDMNPQTLKQKIQGGAIGEKPASESIQKAVKALLEGASLSDIVKVATETAAKEADRVLEDAAKIPEDGNAPDEGAQALLFAQVAEIAKENEAISKQIKQQKAAADLVTVIKEQHQKQFKLIISIQRGFRFEKKMKSVETGKNVDVDDLVPGKSYTYCGSRFTQNATFKIEKDPNNPTAPLSISLSYRDSPWFGREHKGLEENHAKALVSIFLDRRSKGDKFRYVKLSGSKAALSELESIIKCAKEFANGGIPPKIDDDYLKLFTGKDKAKADKMIAELKIFLRDKAMDQIPAKGVTVPQPQGPSHP